MSDVHVRLFPGQREVLKSKEKIILFLCSRSYGKSYTVGYWVIFKLLTDCFRVILVNATYSQLRETVKYVLQHLEHLELQYTINTRPTWCKSLLSDHKNIISINVGDGQHHYIKTISSDNIETIRGSSCDAMALDEAAIMDEQFIDTAIPCLRGHPDGPEHNYQILLATTPTDTSSWLFKRYVEKHPASFREIKASAAENHIEFSQEKLDYLRDSMTSIMWKREILCEWIALNSDSMAYAFHDDLVRSPKDLNGWRLFLSCDINNKNLQSVSGWFNKTDLYIQHGINIETGGNPQKVAGEFHKLYSGQPVRQLTVGGDRYGSNQSTTAQKTFYEQLFAELKRLGWSIIDKTLKSNPSVWDSNETFMRLCEKNHFWIDSGASEVIRHLKEVQWEKGAWKMNKKLLDSGWYDSIRYICWSEFQSNNQTIKSIRL
jgi:hypothetical protein